MKRPEFDELVGADVEPEERARLRDVHEMLVAAGPPPELTPALRHPPGTKEHADVVRILPRGVPRRRLAASIVLAAALALAAFGGGYLVGDRGGSAETGARIVKLVGTADAQGAVASLRVWEPDDAGNHALQLTVRGLEELPRRGYYELGMIRDGKLQASCGFFNVAGEKTVVRLNASYDITRFEGWAIVAHLPGDDEADADRPFLLTSEAET